MSTGSIVLPLVLIGAGCVSEAATDRISIIPIYLAESMSGAQVTIVHRKSAISRALDASLEIPTHKNDHVAIVFRSDTVVLARRDYEAGEHLVVFAPASVDIRPEGSAKLPVSTRPLFGNEAPSLLGGRLSLWRDFPLVVEVRRLDGDRLECDIDPKRSAPVRAAAADIGRFAGFPVFHVLEPTKSCRLDPDIAVLMTDSSGPGRNATSFRSSCAQPFDETPRCFPDWIESASITLVSTPSIGVVQHELLHALGLGHTCIILSAMATEFSPEEITQCSEARQRLGLYEPLILRRVFSKYDAVSIHLLRSVAPTLEGVEAETVTWLIL